MKKLIIVLFLLFSINTYSQITTEDDIIHKRDTTYNELSIGALNLVIFGALDVAYERILNPSTSVTGEVFILALNRENETLSGAFSRNFSFTGKVKYFFGEQSASGLYAHGMAMLSSGEYEEETDNPDFPEVGDYTDLALGFGVGGKLVAKQGFFVDVSAGIGRNLFHSYSPTIVGQFNANMGLRF